MPRTGNNKHTPVLFSHPESGEVEPAPDDQSASRMEYSRQLSSSSTGSKSRIKLRSSNPFPTVTSTPTLPTGSHSPAPTEELRTVGLPPRAVDVYSQFTRKFRPNNAEGDSRHDPDQNYFQKGLGELNDVGDSEDEAPTPPMQPPAVNGPYAQFYDAQINSSSPDIDALTQAERERLEWQTMLASVLDGDVFRSEKTRIVRALETVEARNNARQNIWLGIRAWLRGRSDSEELFRLEDRRSRVVAAVYEEVMSFRVITEHDPSHPTEKPPSPIEQVNGMLDRFDVACSLYPSIRAMRDDKPNTANTEFVEKIDALISWSKLYVSLLQQLRKLQMWTGSETLDVTQPNTTSELAIVGSEAGEHADSTTFVERVLKEDSLQRTFEKGALVTIHTLIESTRRVVTSRMAVFTKLNLPSFEHELVMLISFPTKLIEASLRVRLDSASRMKDPNIIVLDAMTDDFRLAIALACTLKRKYQVLMAEDDAGYWKLPPCIPVDYDQVLLQSLLLFFKLLHWKLKSGTKGIYFKETEVLDAQDDLMDEVSMTIEGGAAVIAEQLCGLTNRLLHRVINYFVTQIEVPASSLQAGARDMQNKVPTSQQAGSRLSSSRSRGQQREDDENEADFDVVLWLSKVLESVRMRYRKLQRYARGLTQRFSNSAEYSLDGVIMDQFIDRLVSTDHFLIYTDTYEEEAIYIVGSSGLQGRPFVIQDMLMKAYNVTRSDDDGSQSSGYGSNTDSDFEEPGYLLFLTPSQPFVWKGFVMMFGLRKIDLRLDAQRIRLVADGTQARLSLAKSHFTTAIYGEISLDEDENGDVDVNDDSGDDMPPVATTAPIQLHCLVEQQAHLPNVNRELRKISRALYKLADTIVGSVHTVRTALHGCQGYQELLENWYNFASDHGQHAQKQMDPTSWVKFAPPLTKLAISWVAFICDDCDPTDRKTFRWAVTALEFAMTRTHGTNILHLPGNEFTLLRQKVASCMTLLISHFDILGARSNLEASKERERLAEIRRMEALIDTNRALGAGTSRPQSPVSQTNMENQSLRLRWDEPLKRVRELDQHRLEIESRQRAVGRVVDEEKLEDKSLLFLASSKANISVRWQQGRFIGAGAFGSVYLAVNLDSGGLMAAKEIKFQDMNTLSNLYRQIKDELSVMEILQHPNIVEYYGMEVHRDKVFIFEEYCQNGSLATLLEHGRIEDETVLQVYTMQMLDGLAYLHSQGVVHRDIKPDNVLLDHRGVIKFVDFGAAKIIAKGNQKSMARHSRRSAPRIDPVSKAALENSLTGTPMYMSPEVIKNDKRGWNGAMDIWSLGCVVLECATGRKPWNSNLDNEWAIIYQIGQADRAPQLPDRSQLSDLGISFIRQCLTLDPMKRPTANELLNHPWMQSFRADIEDYDEGDLVRPSTPDDPLVTGEPTIARAAHEQELREMKDILFSPAVEQGA